MLRRGLRDVMAELEFYLGDSRRTAGNNKGEQFVITFTKDNTRRLSYRYATDPEGITEKLRVRDKLRRSHDARRKKRLRR